MKILLPVDGSEVSLDAVRHALSLAREGLRAEFVLLNVQEPTTLYEMVLAPDAGVLEQVSQAAGSHALEAAAALLRSAGVGFESEVAAGDAGHMVLDAAERYGCDAIVMGARGVGHLKGALIGSVSQWVLHHAAVPVTIVHHVEPEAPD